ncbi:ABC transporter permease [Romboutsia weinsteinii]|uniref:ABC transporter permease n=1 Tax=Romboutsia weinsteinii TaxID=2020949 RepID=A0A371J692_9FIRM|nr:ABC transporter permease [Romboutsia weinsteinii]RDY28187.1 ABC transporter permease [Romboutsia weinsteinii]
MTFSSIVKKNFSHNFKKYISFYFVNSLIIAMLFMYGSLMFNSAIVEEVGTSSLYYTVNMALMGITLFSIVFITYTNISFLKNRGKEFGMYLTLGMTSKDLIKLILIENFGVMVASLITGIISGCVFGRLFYMGLNKILVDTNIVYDLNYKSFLLSIGVFVLIFIGNIIFNIFYIKRVSIIDAIKADKKRGIGNANITVGFISLILLVISMYCLPKTMLREIFKEQSYMIGVFVFLLLICPYMLLGSSISLIKKILHKFPKLYNNNLLVLSSLSHRFLDYRNLLYILSLLMAGAMFYVGYSYSIYSSSKEYVNLDNPYDIMFIESDKYNKVEKEEVKDALGESKNKIEKYNVLEFIEVPMFKEEKDVLTFWDDKRILISESNYNMHMKSDINLNPNESMYITVANEKMDYEHQSSILTVMDENQLEEVQIVSAGNNYKLSKENYKQIAGTSSSLYLDSKNIKEEKNVPFINARATSILSTYSALVIDDSDYDFLKSNLSETSFKSAHLINIKNGDKVFENLLNYLRDKNGFDDSYWNEGNIFGIDGEGERVVREDYRPIYKEELVKLQLDNNGMMLFTMMFIGILFVIANGVVLYYKVLSDIQDEKERMTSLYRIGVLEKEAVSMISKELAITFFVPIVVGGGLGLYFLYVMVSNSGMTELLMRKSILVLAIGILIQFIFYLISKRRYIKESM